MAQLTRRQVLARGAALAFGAVPFADALAAAAPPTGIFRELDRSLRGDVIQRGAPGYNAARVLYDTRFDAVKPQAIAYCESLTDVQKTVRWARKHGVRIVPRSGGHSYGGYSTTSGVIVDVSRLHAISVTASGRAAVGAGAQLLDVYTALAARGRMIPGGTCPTVGIGGLTQGGGIGLSGRKYGLTSDNLLEATVVLADGSVAVANAQQHQDLFWALRGGGGGNFGIVTRFVFRTHPASDVTTYSLEWPWSDAKAVVQAWQQLAPHAPDELASVLNVSAAAGGGAGITSAGQFFGSETALRSLLAPLANAGTPTRYTTTPRTFLGAVHYFAGGGGGRSTFAAKSSIGARLLTSAGIDALLHQIEAKRTAGTGSGIVLLDAWGGAINRVPKARTAFVHRGALFSLQYLAYWSLGEPAAPNLAWLRRCYAATQPYLSGFAYQNYIDPDLSTWPHAYYGSNLPRLRQVKRRYDPHNVFHFRQSIRRA
ncbi:MAG TPA: FAD-binding oxidoreductase [Gaiellaceae bacterium]